MQAFTTDRLSIKDWTPHLGDKGRRSSLEASLAGILTPEVLRHLPPPLKLSGAGSVSAWVEARAQESDVYLIQRTSDESLLGLLILASFDGEPPTIHIGYLLAEPAWGQGFASELIKGLVRAVPRPARLLAGVEADNPASARVLEKAGFRQPSSGDLFELTVD